MHTERAGKMMEMISLSIIVPAQAPHDIDACLASICGQMRSHHELIVVSDGAGALERVRRQQRQFHNVNFTVCEADRPPSAADGDAGCHCGACLARGDYLVFVGAGQLLRPGTLALVDQLIARQEADPAGAIQAVRYPQRGASAPALPVVPTAGPAIAGSDAITRLIARERRVVAQRAEPALA